MRTRIKAFKMSSLQNLLSAIILLSVVSNIGEAENRLATQTIKSPREASQVAGPQVSIENLSTKLSLLNASNTENGVWILIPNNMSVSQLSETDFNLFKLNTDQLFGEQVTMSSNTNAELVESSDYGTDQLVTVEPHLHSNNRESRKMKFFPNFMRKPKVSPLYLVNGTVCRFVNAQPICTTLSTTGLFGGNNRPLANNGGLVNGLFQQGQQGLQGQQQQQNQFQQGGQQRQTLPFNQQG